MKKLFRSKDSKIKCIRCGAVKEIGYNYQQSESYSKLVEGMKETGLCPKCLVRSKIDGMIDYDPVLIETAKNMIAVGVLS